MNLLEQKRNVISLSKYFKLSKDLLAKDGFIVKNMGKENKLWKKNITKSKKNEV